MATLKCSIISSCIARFSLLYFFLPFYSHFSFSSCLFLPYFFHYSCSITHSRKWGFFLQPYYTYFPFCLLSKYPSHFPCLQSTKWYAHGLVRTARGKAAADSEVVRVRRRLERRFHSASVSISSSLLSVSLCSLYLSCAPTPSPFV